ncbi:acyltransferase [Jeotgalibacillus sp. JSM ZJ347]|uniref:acyltransferase n=1 Tax=Jeotgalibacillus sp. JSM ZJ347 TaxID=3342117 RepID=UPI0035A82DAD
MKREIKSIYYIRTFAMLMVVLVHVTAPYEHLFSPDTIQHFSYHFVNRIIRVEAGIFIMLVGIVFFYNYRNRIFTKDVFFQYWKKRVWFILVPYIIWSFIYEYEAFYYGHSVFVWSEVIERVLTGGSKYQLHFIFTVVQFYLIFPLVLWIAQKSQFIRKYIWVFGIVIEFYFFFNRAPFGLSQYPLFVENMGAFLLGASIGLYYEKITAYITSKRTWLLAGVFAVSSVALILIRYQNAYGAERVPIPESLYKGIAMVFLLVGSLFFFFLAEKMVSAYKEDTTTRIRQVAYYSFGFYLLHPLIIRQMEIYLPIKESGISWHLAILLHYIFVVIICYLIIWFFHRFIPGAGLFYGKLPKKAPLFWQTKKEA